MLHSYVAPFLAVHPEDLILHRSTFRDMADFNDLRTQGFATRSPEGSELATMNSREEVEGNRTAIGVNDAKKKNKTLRYRDQM